MPAPQLPDRRRQRPWLLPLAIFVVGGGIALALWFSPKAPPAAGQLEGKLMVFVRPPEQGTESRLVEESGALPVRAGGIMSLQIQLNQPAYTYLIWLDTEGKAVPLYPWNAKELEITDIQQPPPLRQAAKLVYSPLFGGGWTFGSRGGMETVLLLARRTPLPEGTKLGSLLSPLPPTSDVLDPKAVALWGIDGGAQSVSSLLPKSAGQEAAPAELDAALRALLMRLAEHFELIRAVRFAHVGDE